MARRDPLNGRHLRTLREERGKYLAVFLLLAMVIAQVCGFSVADESLQDAYWESFSTYNVEDGNFTVQNALNARQWEAVESLGVRLEELFSADVSLLDDNRIRIFENRHSMNLACVMSGRLAESPGEIAIDRMFAQGNGLGIGDVLSDGNRSWTITGTVALPDYSALFENNNDALFDAAEFGVAVVAHDDFASFGARELTHRYAWQYGQRPANEREEKELSDRFLAGLLGIVRLEDYLPRHLNQAICFTGQDMGDRKVIMSLCSYLAIAIIAFVFGATLDTTIKKESAVIGTLRASGYARLELVRHYLALPLLVTLAAEAVGLVAGFTVMKDIHAASYYDSYSLPTYTTRWNLIILANATIGPLLLILAIDGALLLRRLSLSPLSFLRRDLRRRREGGVVRLSKDIGFFSRFRLRVILQNLPDYAVLFAGILFAELLLMYGLAIPSNLRHHQDILRNSMIANYQYLLTVPQGALTAPSHLETLLRRYDFTRAVETSNPDAEKFMAYALRSPAQGLHREESIMVYGIDTDSRYVHLSPGPNEAYVSSAYAEKYGLHAGDGITLLEEHADKKYTFTVHGVYDYEGALALFMRQADVNELLGYDKDMFAGYFSDTPITDIPRLYIGQVIDFDSLSKANRQLIASLQGLIRIVTAFSMLMFFVLMYVLSKTIIEKNSPSISMAKILGYQDSEINSLYVNSTSTVTAACIIGALPLASQALKWMYDYFVATRVKGWIPLHITASVYLEIIVMGLSAYAVVAFFEMRRIKDIPMNEALSNAD